MNEEEINKKNTNRKRQLQSQFKPPAKTNI